MECTKMQIKDYDDIPAEFPKDTVDTVLRILGQSNVIGVLYFVNGTLIFTTVPDTMMRGLYKTLPVFSKAVHQALCEINIQDKMVAYRVATSHIEVTVVGKQDYGACVVHKLYGKGRKNYLKTEIIVPPSEKEDKKKK